MFYDAQYHDAVGLLSNPKHEVENPIDMDEFNALRERLDLDKILVGTVTILAIVLAVFFVVIFLFVIGPRTTVSAKRAGAWFYFPASREDYRFMLAVWGRMGVWFIGACLGLVIIKSLHYF